MSTQDSGSRPPDKKRDAATEATDSGVKLKLKAINSQCDITPKLRINAMPLYAKPDRKSAARTLRFELTPSAQDARWGLEPVLMADDAKIVSFTRNQDQQTQAHQVAAMARRAEHDAL